MKELVEVIAKSLVENPEEVTVTERQSGKTTVVELKVAPSESVNRAELRKRFVQS